jgi:hypothetical protein
MDIAILGLVAALLAASVVGGLATAWGWEKRTLALKTRVDALEIAVELFKGQLVGEIKRRSGAEGLKKRAENKEMEELAQLLQLKNKVQNGSQLSTERPWWETEGVKG